MYHLKLVKGRSYQSKKARATNIKPDVYVDDKEAAEELVGTGHFKLIEVVEDDKNSGGDDALETMTVPALKKLAKEKAIDIKGLTRREDIAERIKNALNPGAEVGDNANGGDDDDASGGDDPANQFIGG